MDDTLHQLALLLEPLQPSTEARQILREEAAAIHRGEEASPSGSLTRSGPQRTAWRPRRARSASARGSAWVCSRLWRALGR